MSPLPRGALRRTRGVAVGAALVLAVTACGAGQSREDSGGEGGGATDTGVTADSVKVGATFPLTGVAAPGYSEIPTGARAYFDYVNANGGVYGRKIDYLVEDDGYNPSNTSKATDKLVLQEEVFATVGSLGTPTHNAVVDFLNQEGVPDFFVSSGALAWGDDPSSKPTTFGWQTDYESEGKVIGQYIAENLPDAKVGLFLQDDDFGRDGAKGINAYIEDQVVSTQRYTSGNTDVGPQVAALKAAGADVVVGFDTPSYTALTQLVSLKLGYEPQWIYSNVGSDQALIGSLLEKFSEGQVKGTSALDGIITTQYIEGLENADSPWVQLWQKVWDEHGKGGELSNYRIYGMSQAYTFVQALMAAGPELTREGLIEAMESDGAGFEGPNLAPYRYSAESHLGVGGMRVIQVQGEGTKELTPVQVTDIGDAEITEDDSDAANDAPPESGVPPEQG